MPDGPYLKNPTFIIYGDIRPGYRVLEKFLKRKKNHLKQKTQKFLN